MALACVHNLSYHEYIPSYKNVLSYHEYIPSYRNVLSYHECIPSYRNVLSYEYIPSYINVFGAIVLYYDLVNMYNARRGLHDPMVVGFTTTCAISAYYH